ncbi:MAG: hypothetical protein AAF456_21850 [Planctomycetota bacterium]
MFKKLIALACCAVLCCGVVSTFSACSKTPEAQQNAPGADAPPPRSERPGEEGGDAQFIE